MMESKKVLISILNWMKYEDTIACIHSIRRNTTYNNYKIIVVDNHSINDSVKIIQSNFPEITIISSDQNLGYAGGHELVLKEAICLKSDFLWLLNPDTEVQPNTLENLLKAANKYGEGVYGSVILNEDNTIQSCGEAVISSTFEIEYENNLTNIYSGKKYSDVIEKIPETMIRYVDGAAFFIPLTIIKKYGFIDSSYFLYAEELDYCSKLLRNKIPTFIIPSSVIKHQGSSSIKLNPNLEFLKTYYNNRNHILFSKKYGGLTNKKIINDNNGAILMIRKLFSTFFNYKILKDHNYAQSYYEILGIIHGTVGKKGKWLNPEKFLYL